MSLYPDSKTRHAPIVAERTQDTNKGKYTTPNPSGAEEFMGDTGESHALGIFRGHLLPSSLGSMLSRGNPVIFKDPIQFHLCNMIHILFFFF